jgi:asparagine synthase (glutamine-hydrolysing)
MCGIAGIYGYHYASNSVDRLELRRIRDHMAARGPDGAGEWFSEDEHVGLAHRRLSIIDLSDRGAQPMANQDGNLVITFNGEIYNYRELRQRLEVKGYKFRTQTDTEVLLHLYADKGEDMLADLRGMFAFGLWDRRKSGLLLARDPYGIKPLYYADDGWTFRFASQVKALLAGGHISRQAEPAGWAGFALFGSVPEPFTTYEDIHSLPAGSKMWVDRLGGGPIKQYFSLALVHRAGEVAGGTESFDEEYLQKALADSVRHHLIADVPIGAFLSSGIDSGALVGLMRDAGQDQIQTVTLAFEEFRGTANDEAPLAEKVAALYETKHTSRYVSEKEFREDLPSIVEAMDLPTIDGLNSWFVSKAAKELGLKVAISGLGGDELFAGYPSFRDVPRSVRALAVPSRVPLLGRLVRHVLSRAGLLKPKIAGLLEYGGRYPGAYLSRRAVFMPWELSEILGKEMATTGLRRLDPINHIDRALHPSPRTSYGKVAVLESTLYMRNQLLRDTDWASMAHSLEVRVPLVDAVLVEAVARFHGSQGSMSKRLLAYAPRRALPSAIVHRAKTGFQTPVQRWLQTDSQMQAWRQLPSLERKQCPWARRWAFQIRALS